MDLDEKSLVGCIHEWVRFDADPRFIDLRLQWSSCWWFDKFDNGLGSTELSGCWDCWALEEVLNTSCLERVIECSIQMFFFRFYRSVTVIYNQLKKEVSQTLYISCSSTKSLQTFKPFNRNLSRSASLFLCSMLLFLLCSLAGHEGSAVFHCWEAADPPQGPSL